MEGAEEPEAALRGAGLFFSGGAIAYLTPGQKAVLLAELEAMEVRACCSPLLCCLDPLDAQPQRDALPSFSGVTRALVRVFLPPLFALL